MIQNETRVRWIVAVDGEVRYTTETDNRSEAETWADHNLRSADYEIMSTTPEAQDFSTTHF